MAMTPFFQALFTLLLIQRLVELTLSSRNERLLRLNGAYEVGRSHYIYIVLLHVFFFISLLAEVNNLDSSMPHSWPLFFCLFILAQALRFWSIMTLGVRWTTRVIILPNAVPISSGPYRFFRHPNYTAVVCELLVIPLIFGAFYTATMFTILNGLVLIIRIREENKALASASIDTSS